MENFRRQFLVEAAGNLRALAANFQAEIVPDSVKRDAFRTLHTIKGTAQTFGVEAASRLAHELENLLSITKNFDDGDESKSFFLEGINFLIESLQQENFKLPHHFAEKLRSLVPTTARSISENFAFGVPDELFSQLTAQEKNAVRSAKETGKNLFCFEVGYNLANFAHELINFRELLDKSGEIIATLPGAASSGDGRINFRILYASQAEAEIISAISQAGAAEIIFNSSPDVFSNNAPEVLAQIVGHGKTTAKRLGKQIEFEISADEANLPSDKLKLIFDIALHLVRNAVDHAVEITGKIEINLKEEKTGWRLIVSDNGRGIDLEKIKEKAIAGNFITDAPLTEQETINLIFLPEFSTKSSVTEISGRGIGLDSVRSAVEKVGGTINVESSNGRGTTFEVVLPR